jgi:hypothetical protein
MDLRRREKLSGRDRVRLDGGAERCGEVEDAGVGREEQKSRLAL